MIVNKTKIGWCTHVWNPVIGCKNNCPYCYAKKINQRFKYIKDWNKPEWRESAFNKSFPKKPALIFVNSMSDICNWNPKWLLKVIKKIKEYPEHRFLFLTKSPSIYRGYIFPKNVFKGVTLTGAEKWTYILKGIDIDFISYEPLMHSVKIPKNIKWVIVGKETGNRKNKIIPDSSWINNIAWDCLEREIPLFMKNNLKETWNTFSIQQYPEELICTK